MVRYTEAFGIFAAMAVLVSLGCEAPASIASDVGGQGTGNPILPNQKLVNRKFDPADFVAHIDNPYLPLTPGTAFHYRSETPDGVELNDVVVTDATKQILGVAVTVVHDQVFLNKKLSEDTFDWLAQDTQGNVWYFGEDSKEIKNGQVVSTEGSWEAGVGDNKPGIIMLADPKPGLTYHQEVAPGVAEDVAKVLSLKATPEVPFGAFDRCLQTMEWSLLEHGVREHKFYCPGVGLVLEDQPKGGHIRNELIAITHS